MRKLIKVIAVPVLCCIILLFFMVDFHSHGEEVSAPRATDVKKTEPAIAVWQEEKEVVPIAIEETEELTEIIEEMSKEDVELIALVTMAEAEGECEEGKRLVIDTILNRVDSEHFPDTVYEVIYQPNQFSSMWNGRVDRCEVRKDICGLVYEELESRTNYDVVFFTAGEYSAYGVPMFQVGNHYFQDTSKERRIIMRNFLAVVSYTLAAMSGICFAGGIAILSTGKGH